MAIDAPTWSTQTDSAGLGPNLAFSTTDDGFISTVGFSADFLSCGDGSPLSGTSVFSGSLTRTVPEGLPLLGHRLVLRGFVAKTPGSSLWLSCSVGDGVRTQHWSLTGATSADPGLSAPEQAELEVLQANVVLDCYTSDFNPSQVGVPPYPPLPPLPVTVVAQARVRADFELVRVTVETLAIEVLTSSHG